MYVLDTCINWSVDLCDKCIKQLIIACINILYVCINQCIYGYPFLVFSFDDMQKGGKYRKKSNDMFSGKYSIY